jgi:hypothetical protein
VTEENRAPEELSPDELEGQAGEELPDREAMSILPIEPTSVPIPVDDDFPRPDPGPVERHPTV